MSNPYQQPDLRTFSQNLLYPPQQPAQTSSFSDSFNFNPNPTSGPTIQNALNQFGSYNPSVGDTGQTGWFDNLMKTIVGGTNADGSKFGGLGTPFIGAVDSLFKGYTGLKNAKTAQKTLDFQKNAFREQFDVASGLARGEWNAREDSRARQDPRYTKVDSPV